MEVMLAIRHRGRRTHRPNRPAATARWRGVYTQISITETHREPLFSIFFSAMYACQRSLLFSKGPEMGAAGLCRGHNFLPLQLTGTGKWLSYRPRRH